MFGFQCILAIRDQLRSMDVERVTPDRRPHVEMELSQQQAPSCSAPVLGQLGYQIDGVCLQAKGQWENSLYFEDGPGVSSTKPFLCNSHPLGPRGNLGAAISSCFLV